MDHSKENAKIALLLSRISELYDVQLQYLKRQGAPEKELKDSLIHKQVYANAAANVKQWPFKIDKTLKPAKIQGVGKGIITDIFQYLDTGAIIRLQNLESEYGPMLIARKELIGRDIGPKKAFDLVSQGYYRIQDVPEEKLTKAAKIGIAHRADAEKRIPRKEIEKIEMEINLPCLWEIAGSYRRGEATSGDIDIIMGGCKMDQVLKSLDWLLGDVISSGEKVTQAYTKQGYRIDLKIVPKDVYPFALLHFTGSSGFNVTLRKIANKLGLKLSEYGLFDKQDKNRELPGVRVRNEKEIFYALGLKYMAPIDRVFNAVLEEF